MIRYTLSIILTLSMVAMPLLAAATPPLSCENEKCCRAMEAHHDMAGMLDDACQCHMVPLSPCHIAADPQPPQQAILLPVERSQIQHLAQMVATAETVPVEFLSGGSAVPNQVPRPNLHPPPIYLLTCTFIV